MVKKRWPSGVSTIWVTTRPGVWKAACRFQRGQVPPKREKGKASPAKRLEMFPAASTRSMKKGMPRAPLRPRVVSRCATCSTLAPNSGAEPVDIVAMRLGRLEEGRIGHHDRAGGIIGEAHVEQPPGRRVGRRRGLDHLLQQRPELDQGELIGEPKVRLSGRSNAESISRLRCRS